MQAYNIFVKRKENELKGMIDQLSARNQDQKLNDLKMYKLELALSKSRKQLSELEKEKSDLKKEVDDWKKKYELELADKDFYHKSALESKS